MWKCKLLSIASRAHLIKFVSNSFPTHFLSLFKIPNNVHLKSFPLREFFLGSNGKSKKLIIVDLKSIKAPNNLGGLSFGSIHLKNPSLLTKWWWKFPTCSHSSWHRVVRSNSGFVNIYPSIENAPHGPWQEIKV